MKWEQIGECGVDSGTLMIGDPCYFIDSNPYGTWEQFCADFFKHGQNSPHMQMKYAAGHDGLGVAFSTCYGDGVYPVFILNGKEKHVAAVVIMEEEAYKLLGIPQPKEEDGKD